MTQKEFFDINIPIVNEKKDISYKLCDGAIISFVCEKGDKYKLLLNGHVIEREKKYSNYAIRNSFLFIANNYNMHSFQWHPLVDGKTYAIRSDIKLPNKINWNNVIIVSQ